MLAFCLLMGENCPVQGRSDPNRQLLDAEAFCRAIVEEGTVYAFLANHRSELIKDEDFADLFPSDRLWRVNRVSPGR